MTIAICSANVTSALSASFVNLRPLRRFSPWLPPTVIVGGDPNPNRPPNVVRMVILFAAMSIHAFFSIALMSATTLMDGGYYTSIGNPLQLNLLEDQYKGGAIGWAMGEIPILIALTAAFIQWMREDRKETERIDRKAARASAMGESDDLAKYNQYLAELARGQDRKSN